MDIQKLMDSLSSAARMTRSQYHLTLGDLYHLSLENPDAVFCVPAFDRGIANPHSYRGYYADLAFEQSDDRATTAAAVKEMCERAMAETFTGYKGGDYTYADDTPLWLAPYGCTGEAIVEVDATQHGILKLRTKEVTF